MRRMRRVAVVVDSTASWGADVVRGVTRYSDRNGSWTCLLELDGRCETLGIPPDWSIDGVIARLTSQPMADAVLATGIPAVSVSWSRFDRGRMPRCTTDEVACGELAAQHFLERGFRRFAYCGSAHRPEYFDRFGEAFTATLSRRGHECAVYAEPEAPPTTRRNHSAELIAWLRSLVKPIAVLAFDTLTAREVLDACQLGGIAVPEEAAILAGEADVLLSEVSRPKLSYLDYSAETVGYRAAEMLERLMDGEAVDDDPSLIAPAGVVTRQSTDTLAIEDPTVVAALRYIQGHAHEALRVTDIVRHLPVSRRSLEQQFQRALGRSPAQEIRRVRVERAKDLLAHTDLTVSAVAGRCGFEYGEVLTRAFRRELGVSPSAYRRKVQVV